MSTKCFELALSNTAQRHKKVTQFAKAGRPCMYAPALQAAITAAIN